MTIGGKSLWNKSEIIMWPQAIVDSGTTFLILPIDAFMVRTVGQ
jgi:hypothetical protein